MRIGGVSSRSSTSAGCWPTEPKCLRSLALILATLTDPEDSPDIEIDGFFPGRAKRSIEVA
jgi:hypothetical protein